ncbi:hypothetical protein D3C71_1853650 [compost metagenome]
MLQADLVDQAPGQAAQFIGAVVLAQAERKGQGHIVRPVLSAAAGVVQLLHWPIHPGRQGDHSRGCFLHFDAP